MNQQKTNKQTNIYVNRKSFNEKEINKRLKKKLQAAIN